MCVVEFIHDAFHLIPQEIRQRFGQNRKIERGDGVMRHASRVVPFPAHASFSETPPKLAVEFSELELSVETGDGGSTGGIHP